jgi:hypothetical protein
MWMTPSYWTERKSFLPFAWYLGSLLVIFVDSWLTNKATKVRTNAYSESRCYCWVFIMLAATPHLASTLWLGPQIADFLQTEYMGLFLRKISKLKLKHFVQYTLITKSYFDSYSGSTADSWLAGRGITELGSWEEQQDLLLSDFRFCQRCCWLFGSGGMWRGSACFERSCCLHLQG